MSMWICPKCSCFFGYNAYQTCPKCGSQGELAKFESAGDTAPMKYEYTSTGGTTWVKVKEGK
jgi:ABC-type ATPase with predicted acetyltransferase domain